MSRTPIPAPLIHRSSYIAKNTKLFDAFASLIDFVPKELQQMIASALLEKINQKVSKSGEVKLPLDLIIKRNAKSVS